MLTRLACTAALLTSLTACATVTRGTTDDVAIDVTPANASVVTSIGETCQGSCVLKVDRKTAFTVTASAPGFLTQTVSVTPKLQRGGAAASIAGNALAGGVIGGVIDASTGAALDHVPNPVVINLVPAS